MRRQTPIRFLAATVLSASALSHAQTVPGLPTPASSTLPATAPTTTPPPAPLTPAQSPPQRAKVTYADNVVTVSASNSSLNQILRDISRLSGIKISGGVADERVFGDYGPSSTSQVLSILLDGTGSNVLLVPATGGKPAELILTPRLGGPTPPNPNAQSFDEPSESSTEAPPNPVARPIRRQPSPYAPRPVPSPDNPPQAPPNTDETSAPATAQPGGDATQPQSPNGVKTPQQIYDELQRMRQQQAQPQPQQ